MPTAPTSPLDRPVTALRGVGVDRATQLGRLEILTIGDLLLHRPRRYEDRRRLGTIADLQLREPAAVHGRIVAQGIKRWKHGTRCVFEFILEDPSGRLHCRWWNLPYMEHYFHVGDEVVVYGKPVSLRPRTMDHPETEVLENGEESSIHLQRIVPVYPLTEGLSQRGLRGLVWRTLSEFESHIPEPWLPGLADLPTRANAIHMLHFPEDLGDTEVARRRLALDEFIPLQLEMQRRRQRLQANARAWPCSGDNRLMKRFLAQLGFKLTAAQTRVLREIRADLGGRFPMRRLLQGDVGSGKTAVAACTALMALESGFNVALMAPTEILAEQHAASFRRWFGPLGVPIELRTGGHRPTAAALQAAAAPALSTRDPKLPVATPPAPAHTRSPRGSPCLAIGTHALIEAAFAPENLGLVIIDEQHKFGVGQREDLVRKGRYPHLLVMTATPIPRTLGLTLYGDLDLSVIDELPAGRGRIRTFVRSADVLPKVWEFVRAKLGQGRQAYVVYPRVEEGDLQTGMKAVRQEYERLQAELAPWRVGLVHGRMPPDEKESVMTAFRANDLQVLVATSVIEVGVDVPAATVMVIENAESFGLAQLHQLRGRIGRGAHESFCVLVAAAKTDEARQRLRVLEETTDGFRIAEADLQLRGPGELLGQSQSGIPRFQFGDLAQDLALIERAKDMARKLISAIPATVPST